MLTESPVRWLITVLVTVPLSAQTVKYEISIPSPATNLIHVKAEFPASGKDTLPSGWQVATALKGWGSGPYTAADYHELADAQTFLGTYGLDSLQTDGAWVRLAVWPADAYTPAVARNLRAAVEKIARAEDRLMGGPVCGTYTIFLSVMREPFSYIEGLEHSCSHYDILPEAAFATAQGTPCDQRI